MDKGYSDQNFLRDWSWSQFIPPSIVTDALDHRRFSVFFNYPSCNFKWFGLNPCDDQLTIDKGLP